MRQRPTIRPFISALLFSVSLGITLGVGTNVSAAISDMSSTLPDDNYTIRKPDGTKDSNGYCANQNYANGGNAVCRADMNTPDTSHQYITMSFGRPNDAVSKNKWWSRKLNIEMYMDRKPTSSKSLSIVFVNRGISDALACSNKLSIAAVYATGDGLPSYEYKDADGNKLTADLPAGGSRHPDPGCPDGRQLSFANMPAGAFTPVEVDGKVIPNAYHAKVTLTIDIPKGTPNPEAYQDSFHLIAGGGAKLAYGESTATISDPDYQKDWVNTYPTAVADYHKVVFKFRPPCSDAGTGLYVEWDDTNEGTAVQPDNRGGHVEIYKVKSDGTGRQKVGSDIPFSDYGATINIASYAASKTYSYSVEFVNVNGGNGISFAYPYSSASYYIACPGRESSWQLKNASSLPTDIGPYTPAAKPTETNSDGDTVERPKPTNYYPGRNCNDYNQATSKSRCNDWNDWYDANQSAAKKAYQHANFQHSVWNPITSPDAAKNDDHKSFVEYRLKRAGSPKWRNSQNGNECDTTDPAVTCDAWQRKSTAQSATLQPGGSGLLVNDDGGIDYSIPRGYKNAAVSPYRGNDLAFLLKSCDTGNNCDDSSDGPREPTLGDQYCERVVTVPYKMTEGVTDPAKLHSNEVCITLGSASCYEFPWQVNASRSVNQLEGDGDSADAWVNDKYSFDYSFKKEGAAAQTKSIAFTYNNNGVASSEGSRTLGSWGKSYALGPISPTDAGRTFTSSMSYDPSSSADPNNCGTNGAITTDPLTVTVPYYFHIKPSVEGVDSSTEQGDAIDVNATYNLPTLDTTNGRGHTQTDGTQYKITQLINPSSTDTAVLGTSDNVCMIAAESCRVPAGASGDKGKLQPNGSANDSLGIYQYPADSTGTAGLKVGTKICFVASLTKPSHDAAPGAWGHSEMRCTTIVKKPKVQFLGGDLTVGREPQQGGTTTSAASCPGNPSAIIQTASRRSGNIDNSYGSWVELGAFAPGSISGFGSAAFSPRAGDTTLLKDAYKKLLFANTFTGGPSQTPGRYTYSSNSKCLSDAFGMIKTDSTDSYNLIGTGDGATSQAGAYTIVPGDYFSQPGRDTKAFDKTGYATPTGKNLVLGRPVDTGTGGGPPPTDGADLKVNNKYTLPNFCPRTPTTTVPAGWTYNYGNSSNAAYTNNQRNTKSTGCNSNGDYLKTWLSGSRKHGDYSAWTYAAPSGATINTVSSDYRAALIPWGGAKDFSAYVSPTTDGRIDGAVYNCTMWIEPNCYKTTGQTVCWPTKNPRTGCPASTDTNASTVETLNDMLYFSDKSYPAVSFGILCNAVDRPDSDCTYSSDEASMAIRNINITLNDLAAPVVKSVNPGGLYKDGPANNGTIKGGTEYQLQFKAEDVQSGLASYTVQYKDGEGNWQMIKERAAFVGDTATATFDPAVLGRGVTGNFDFRFVVYDKVGNQSAPEQWTKRVDNTTALGADYDAFTGRNIVVYARKDPSKSCSDAGAGGNLTISDNITYKQNGYESITKLPRVIFLADCDITIEDNVTEVDAWLIAREDVRTCSEATIAKFKDNTVDATQCNTPLLVNGAVQAKRLLLLRTYGADLAAGQQPGPAETFNLRPEQILSTWSQGQTAGVTRPIYETDLPPRW